MKQLSGIDAAFLALESDRVQGHGGGLSILDPSTGSEPVTRDRLAALLEERMHLAPVLRRRLRNAPLGLDQPYWVDGPPPDLAFHLRELHIGPEASVADLCNAVADVHARRLHRDRPLWELHLVHGLSDGRQGLYLKIHHALVDGIGGNALLEALFDASPAGRTVTPTPLDEDASASAIEMAARSAVSLASRSGRALRAAAGVVKSAPAALGHPSRRRIPVLDHFRSTADPAGTAGVALRAPATPFNRAVGPERTITTVTLPLAQIREVRTALGISFNDVIMTLCAGALRQLLLEHDALPTTPLIAAAPMSIRPKGDESGGNQLSLMLAVLPTHLTDPLERARAAHRAMSGAKETYGALPSGLLSDVTGLTVPLFAPALMAVAARLRLLEHVRPFNILISSVPGPPDALYCAGARMLSYYPLSQVVDGQALNITAFSYDGGVHVGVIADRSLDLDTRRIGPLLAEELTALRARAAR